MTVLDSIDKKLEKWKSEKAYWYYSVAFIRIHIVRMLIRLWYAVSTCIPSDASSSDCSWHNSVIFYGAVASDDER